MRPVTTQAQSRILRHESTPLIVSAHHHTPIQRSILTQGSGSPSTTGRAPTTSYMPSSVTAIYCFAVLESRTTSSARGSNGMSIGAPGAWFVCYRLLMVKSTILGLGRRFIPRTGGSKCQELQLNVCQDSSCCTSASGLSTMFCSIHITTLTISCLLTFIHHTYSNTHVG